ncbi:MAG: SDR family NAD(P)-dependent oxidoreductase [Nocardioides sp.]
MSRRVLVTGAASGLGAALTAAFRARGDEVLATDLTAPEDGLALDVRSEDDWTSAREAVAQRWGGLDVLVNNAGIAGGGRVDVCTLEEWQRLTDINLFGVVRGTRTFTPMLKAQGSGAIVNIASLAGLVHPPGMASYNAVKAAVVALSETVGHELAPYGVRCTAVCPSYFRTGLMATMQSAGTADADVADKITAMVEQSPISAEEIATAVLAGLDDGLDVIVPDEPARAAVALKSGDREAYDREMRRLAHRLRERSHA